MNEQGGPGRYDRSVNGLVASMVVIVLIVVAFVGFRALFKGPVDVQASPVDYLGTVRELQRSSFDPVYPASLPEGWTAFGVDYQPGTPPTWGLQLHTAEQHYIGIRESSADAGQLLATYVDPVAGSEPDLSTPGGLVPVWSGWSDRGGDHAFTAKVGTQTVIVFGPASVDDLETVVRALTVSPVGSPTSPFPTPTPPPTR